MPLMNTRTTMTANGTSRPLQGLQFEILPYNSLVEFAILADTGATVNNTVYSGSDLLAQSSITQILAVASPIIYPDHYVLNDVAGWNERLSIELVEAAGGTPIVRTSTRITRIA